MPPTDPMLTALRDLADGQRDIVAGLTALARESAVGDGKSDVRAEVLGKLTDKVDALTAAVGRVEGPVVAMVTSRQTADENERANRGKWANTLTADRVVAGVKWLVGVAALLGLGGGVGAGWRGCGAGITMAGDPPAEESP